MDPLDSGNYLARPLERVAVEALRVPGPSRPGEKPREHQPPDDFVLSQVVEEPVPLCDEQVEHDLRIDAVGRSEPGQVGQL